MSRIRVLLDEKLQAHALPLLQDAGLKVDVEKLKPASLLALVQDRAYSALVVREKVRASPEVLEAAGPSLKLIGVVGDSLRNVNLMAATGYGIIVKITEYGNTFEAANLAKRMMVLLLSEAFQKGDAKKATVLSDADGLSPERFSGFELADKTVGLIGCGRVAQALALMIHPHCQDVLGFDNNPRAVYEDFHLPDPLLRPAIEYCQLSEITERADVISIHTSGNEQVYLIDEVFRSPRKPFIINTARDAVINEQALLSALAEKRIRGVAFTLPQAELKSGNFPDSVKPFLDLGNAVIAPSQGRPVGEAHKKNVKSLAAAVVAYLLEGDMNLAVNPPELFGSPATRRYPLSIRTRSVSLPLMI